MQVLNKIIHVFMISALFSMISALLCRGMLVHVLLLVRSIHDVLLVRSVQDVLLVRAIHVVLLVHTVHV